MLTDNKYIVIAMLIILLVLLFVIYYCYLKKKNEINNNNICYAKYVDDVTKMNKTQIDKIFNVLSVDDIIDVIKLANKNGKKIIARGETHSMGGHSIAKDGYIIDTKFFNHILKLDKDNYTVTVEPGITWIDLIKYLNLFGYSPKILQSYASFSVGGSVSVNVHGVTSDMAIYDAIVELVIVNNKGELIKCNREENKELFSLVIGGYGLFGIIVSVMLKIVDNKKLKMVTKHLNVNNFTKVYEKILNDNDVEIKIARLDVTNMEDINLYVLKKINEEKKIISHLNDQPKEISRISQLIYKWMLPNQNIQKIRFKIEREIEKPLDVNDEILHRNSFLYESSASITQLYSPIININKTHILQEYFIPKSNFLKWMTYLKELFVDNKNLMKDITLLNITIRYILKDDTTFLTYANKDMYAFVFYYRINCDKETDNKLKYIHNLLVNKVIKLSGTFYLPYRHHYTYNQLLLVYPMIEEFFSLKLKYDPYEMFYNLWYHNYKPSDSNIVMESNLQNIIIESKYDNDFIIKSPENQYNHNKKSYQKVLSSRILRNKLKEYLNHIFNLLDYDIIYNFVYCQYKINKNIDDFTMFCKLKEYIKDNYTKLSLLYKFHQLINRNKISVTKHVKELLLKVGINYSIKNYVNIGDSGRYIDIFKHELDIRGTTYTLNDSYSYIDNHIYGSGNFIQYDFNKMSVIPIKENSIELVTCLIGLHHFSTDKISVFLKRIHKILKDGGILIIKEYNGETNMIPLLNCLHNIFNSLTMENLQVEEKELRNFRRICDWREIIESCGFVDKRIYTTEKYDPTENYYMCFIKNDINYTK